MLKRIAIALLPGFLINRIRALRLRRFKTQSIEQVFSTVYQSNLWGGEKGVFYSGEGSDPANTEFYVKQVWSFIQSEHIGSVLDLGCGDFRVGQAILQDQALDYTGVDVVPALIDAHTKKHGSQTVRFQCLDIVTDPLPAAVLCLIRQVLQHLSNTQIQSILAKLAAFRYVLITEHLPATTNYVPNMDKVNGPDIRLFRNSGVFLESAPYNLPVQVFLEYPIQYKGGDGKNIPSILRTYLLTHPTA